MPPLPEPGPAGLAGHIGASRIDPSPAKIIISPLNPSNTAGMFHPPFAARASQGPWTHHAGKAPSQYRYPTSAPKIISLLLLYPEPAGAKGLLFLLAQPLLPALTKEGPALTKEGPALTKEGPALTKEGPALTKEGPALTKEGPALTKEGPA